MQRFATYLTLKRKIQKKNEGETGSWQKKAEKVVNLLGTSAAAFYDILFN